MVIEFWSALARSLYNLQKSLFHSRKDQAFSFRMSPLNKLPTVEKCDFDRQIFIAFVFA